MHVSPTAWRDLSRLLDEALDLHPAERAAWLDRQAASQPDRAGALRKLLAAHATSETADLLARLPAVSQEPMVMRDGLAIGDRVGPYRLVRALGSGGMAEVWLAERADGAFAREVALKLPHASLLRRDLAARFARERDILARLEHPHIARLYDAGVSAEGLPYLAMEYVDGRTIGDYCDHSRLDLAARLRLFVQVQDAVQYAHARLVIHRDLKPSNVLVTSEGQARLLDFGIAKLLADDRTSRETQLTQSAGRVLTPDYASPEQIKGEALTTATDIYSLGVMLYELLCGQRPYRLKLASVAQLEEAIVSADPPKPSASIGEDGARSRGTTPRKLAHALAGDLDTIVAKALAKAPAQRYDSAAAFAKDLERHLQGLPVLAQPDSLAYRARKFVRRRKLESAVAAAVLIALVGGAYAQVAVAAALLAGSGVALWQARAARREAANALQGRSQALAAAARAETVKQFVVSFFEAADVSAGGSRKTSALDLLKQARERLDAAQITDDAVRVELLTVIGNGLGGIGELQLAAPVLDEALRLADASLGASHPMASAAHLGYAKLVYDRGDVALSAPHFDLAEQGFRLAGQPVGLAAALRGKASIAQQAGDFDAAIAFAQQAIDEAERQPVDPRALIRACLHLAYMTHQGRRKGALEPARRAHELARRHFGDQPADLLLEAQSFHVARLGDEGDIEAALAELKELLRQRIELLGPEHPSVEDAHAMLAELWLRAGDPLAAVDNDRQHLRIELARNPDRPMQHQANIRAQLATALASARRYDEALAEFRAAEQIYAGLNDAGNPRARLARSAAAMMLTRMARLDEAQAIFTELAVSPSHNSVEAALIDARLGMLRNAQGRHGEAEELLRGAAEAFRDSPTDRYRSLQLLELGRVLVDAGRAAQAIEVLNEARELFAKSQRNGSPDLADIAVNIARAHFALGHAQDALRAAEEAAAFWSRFDSSHPDAGAALLWLARALAATGRDAEAHNALRQAAAILASAGLPGDRALLEQTQRELGGPETARR
jgi:eukaryotic-like serine/threonine-protein kinase